jgi:hypothetical protein
MGLHGVVTWILSLGVVFTIFSSGSVVAAEPPKSAESTFILNAAGAEVHLPAPKFYAVFEHKTTKERSLLTTGQMLVALGSGAPVFKIERIDDRGIVLRNPRKGSVHSVRVGRPIPSLPLLLLTQTVKLTQLLYRSKVVETLLHAEPILVALDGSRAVLEIEIVRERSTPTSRDQPAEKDRAAEEASVVQAPSQAPTGETGPPRRKLDAKVFSEIDVQEVGPDAYVLGAESLKPVFDNVNQMFTDIAPIITPAFSAQGGLSLDITSSVVDGVMNTRGFTVTNPKVAERFGIQVGDTILNINDHPVNSPLGAWATYQELIIRNPQFSELRVNVQRGRNIVTKSYTIR